MSSNISIVVFGTGDEAKGVIDDLIADGVRVFDRKGVQSNDEEWYWAHVHFPESISEKVKSRLRAAKTPRGYQDDAEYAICWGSFPTYRELHSGEANENG